MEAFRNCFLKACTLILWVDVLYDKMRMDERIVSMEILVVSVVDVQGQRDILAIEPMPEESGDSYLLLFRNLHDRDLCTSRLVISDTHSNLVRLLQKPILLTSFDVGRFSVHISRVQFIIAIWGTFIIQIE